MNAFKDLSYAVSVLKENVTNFPIGAVSLDDFKPTEEKIKTTRESLKHLNAGLLLLKAQNSFLQDTSEEPEEEIKETVKSLHEATANTLINNKALTLCLHSHTIRSVLEGTEGDSDLQKKIYAYMRKLFTLNDSISSIQTATEEALQKQLKLKIDCQKALLDYKNFLVEQEDIRNKKLKETNPEIAIKKEKTQRTLKKINISRRLILNFIAASHTWLAKEPLLVEMLEKHKEVVNMDTILKLAQNQEEQQETTQALKE